MKILQGALEIYEMDHSGAIEKLDLAALKQGKFIKVEPICPETKTVCYRGRMITSEKIEKGTAVECEVHGNLVELDKKIAELKKKIEFEDSIFGRLTSAFR
ncbi:MAG: hypothetical protein AB1403_02510 [Candidatus Riflebacteria bacterium]